jgi:ATP/maltotriose-dependent transcriptional regulator MalT
MSGGFVGRPAELDELQKCAARAKGGDPQLVFVEGVPGIGKTSLLTQFASTLSGWRQIVVSGYEDEKRVPFGVLTRLLSDGRTPGSAMDSPAASITIDPIALGADLLQLLGDLEQAAPVAVVIDDAPWADPQSLRALTFALRRLQGERVLVVLTMRSREATHLPPGLLHFGQDRATRIRLSGFDTDEVCELFRQQARGQLLPRRAAERLRVHTAGNPLHLRALFQELPLDELLRTRGPLPAPSSYANLVLAALAVCAEPTRRLLMAAAVLGVQSPLIQAAQLGEVADPLQGLEEAARTGLVDAREDGDGWVVAFRHPLIRSAVYDDLGPATRSRLHGRAAEIQLQKELSHRAAAASGRVDPELVSRLVAQAGDAESSARLSAAADLLLTAARLSPAGAAQDGLLLDAIDLLLRAGEPAEAAVFTEQIAAMPSTVQRTLVQARWAAMEGRHSQVDALAQSVWHNGSPAERALAAAMLAQLAVLRNDNPGAIRWAQEAERTESLSALMADEVKCVQSIAMAMSGEATAGLRILDDPVGGDASSELLATSGILRMVTGDYVGAKRDLQVCVPGHRGWGASPRVLAGLGGLADAEYRSGAWDASKRHAEQAISLVNDTEQSWLLAFVHAMAVLVPAAQGNWREAEEHVAAAIEAARALADGASAATAANAAVHLAFCRGDPLATVTAAEVLVEAPDGAPREPGVMGWAGQYASALIALGRFEDADRVLADQAAVAGRLGRRSALATVARIRGELAMARRQPAEARAAFNTAVTLGAGSATVLDHAWTQTLYGRFLRRAGERRAAGDLLRAARDTFARLGATPFLDSCNAELAACGLAVDRSPAAPLARLTTQEQAVARLVCVGKSNREVAAELVISVKTVGYHLGNTYSKLGVNTRTQLAALLSGTA